MTGKTHLLIGLAASLALLNYRQGQPIEAALYAGIMIGSLAPDIDHPSSLITNWIPPLKIFSLFFEHRGIFHAAILPALMAAAAAFIFPTHPIAPFISGLAIGWGLHLFADALTIRGIPALWPLSSVKIGLPIVNTGGILEWIFGFAVMGFAFWQVWLIWGGFRIN